MRIVQCTQGKEDWFIARCGRVTASEMSDALKTNETGVLKGITSAKREELKAFLIGEILTGVPDMMGYVSKFMERGTLLEGEAREHYEERYETMVQPIGFVIHPTNDRSGASPDGLIGEEGGLEIKVPGIAKHVQYLETPGLLPPEYEPQVMWNLACTGRTWWDFTSFCPIMPREMRLFTVRVYADAKRIAEMEDGLDKFLAETDLRIANLRRLYPPLPEPERTPEDFGDEGLTDDDLDAFFGAANVGAGMEAQ